MAVESGLRRFDGLPTEIRGRVRSVILFNSLVRGDYVPGASDIDLLAVFDHEPSHEETEALIKCFTEASGLTARPSGEKPIFDVLCISVDELPLEGTPAAARPTRWKMLGIYAFDFVAHSRVLRGEDFRPRLVVRDPMTMLAERLGKLRELYYQPRKEGLEYMAAIGAGEFIRLAQLVFGEKTIDKRVVFANFDSLVPEFPGKEFAKLLKEEYLTGAMRRMSVEERASHLRECETFVGSLIPLLERSISSR
jgi:hypothetical protein